MSDDEGRAPSDASVRALRQMCDDFDRAPSEARERVIRQVCERIAAEAAARQTPAPRESAVVLRKSRPPPRQVGPTLHSLPVGLGVAGEEERGRAPVTANDVAEPPRQAVLPQVVEVPAFFKSTEASPPLSAEEWARRGALPFVPRPPSMPEPKRAPKTASSRVYGFAETAAVDDHAVARSIRSVLPFPTSLSPLTLLQYASLRGELDFWPHRSAEILRRYHLPGDAALAGLDAYWGRQFAAHPQLAVAFGRDYATYTAWLRTQGTCPAWLHTQGT